MKINFFLKKTHLFFYSLCFFLFCSSSSWGQLLTWNTFNNLGTETTEPNTSKDANVSISNLTLGTITPASNSNRFGGTGWFKTGNTSTGNTLDEAIAGNSYIQFIVSPNSGYRFTPSSLVFIFDTSSSGPTKLVLRSSIDSFSTNIGSIITINNNSSHTIAITSITNVTTATTFRLYGYGATSTSGAGGFDCGSSSNNVTLNGATSLIPIITGAATATTFTTTYGTASPEQSFSVSGSYLTANIVANAPTGFEVSSDGSIYGATAIFTQTSGTATGTLRIRLAATAAVTGTSYNSKAIALTSTNATTVNITTTASGNAVSTKNLTITANNQSKNYGTSLTIGTTAFTAIGLANSETIGGVTLTCSEATTTSVAVGTYPIVPSGATGGTFTSSNYAITYTNGTFTVNATIANAPTIVGITAGDTTLSVAFTAPSNNGGVTIINYEYSLNGSDYTALSPSQTTSPIVITGLTNDTSYPITIRAVNSVGSGTASNSISATPVSASTPLINVIGILGALNTTYGTPSSTTTFSVSGSALQNDIVISAPTGFEISTNNSTGFNTSIALTPTNGVVSSTTIYVRLAATAIVASSPFSGNISLTSSNALPVSVATASSVVVAKNLTITGLSAIDKVYDRLTSVSFAGSTSYSGLVNGESFSVSGSVSYAFSNASVGSNKTVIATGTYDAPSSNYTLTQPSFTATISAANLTLVGVSVSSKTYDGTTTANVSGTLNGILSGDTVTYSGVGTFASANIGLAIVVTPSITLNGAQSVNYSLTQPATLTANITSKSLTITGITASNKVYNGNTTATFIGNPVLNGVVGSENVILESTAASAAFANKNIGTGKTVTFIGYTISGTDASNYTLTQPSSSANITVATLTITGLTINSKMFDNTTIATFSGTPTLNGIIVSDNVILDASGASATFASATVGNSKTVTFTGFSITGTDAANYSLTQPSSTANITAVTKYYFVPTSSPSLTSLTQWWSNADGTGVNPSNFTTSVITYQLNVNTTTSVPWTVSGTGSKIVVGDGTNTPNLTIASGFAISGTIDVSGGAILTCAASTLPTFGTLSPTSTVNISNANTLAVPSTNITFGNLIVSNTATLTVTSATSSYNFNIAGNFDVSGGVFSTNASTSTFILNFTGTSKTIKSSSTSNYNKVNTININSGSSYTLLSDLFYSSTSVRTLILSGSLNISGYTLDLGINTFTSSGTLTQNASSKVKTSCVSSALPVNSVWDGTVEYYSSAAQALPSGATYNNLTISGPSTKTLAGASSVKGVLTVDSGATLTIATGINLTLKSDANGTARVAPVLGTISGDVTVERFIPAKRAWRALTAPLKGSNVSIFSQWQNGGTATAGIGVELWGPGGTGSTGNGLAVGPSNSMLQYDNTTAGTWTTVNDTKTTYLFTTSRNNAFMVFPTGAYGSGLISGTATPVETTLKATGQLITGDVSYTIPSTSHTLIGNPYASPISPLALLTANTTFNNNVWIWDPNAAGDLNVGVYNLFTKTGATTGTYTNTTSSSYSPNPTPDIQSGQAFFVKAASGTQTLTISENFKTGVVSSNAVFRDGASAELLRLGLYKQESNSWSGRDGAIALFFADANANQTPNKMANGSENIAFTKNTELFASAHYLPLVASDVLNVKVWNTTAGSNYKLKINTEQFTTINLNATLEDLFTNSRTPIALNGTSIEYPFAVTTDAASTGNRFRIVFETNALGIINPKPSGISILPNPITGDTFQVNLGTLGIGMYAYTISNALGQEVEKGNIDNASQNTSYTVKFKNATATGMYIMKVTGSDNSVFTAKIIKK